MDYVEKVIRSCRTLEQLESCSNWIKNSLTIYEKTSAFNRYFQFLDYQSFILLMQGYLKNNQEILKAHDESLK